MLRMLAETCTAVLEKNGALQGKSRAVYLYGFELFWSIVLCVSAILLFAALGGYLPLALVMLSFFIPIRIPAGGYHAKSYGSCFVLTNLIAAGCVGLSVFLWERRGAVIEGTLWVGLAASLACIWLRAPVISEGHPLKPDRVVKNRRYAHGILAAEVAAIVVLRLALNHCAAYTAMVTSCAVAVMMALVRKGGR